MSNTLAIGAVTAALRYLLLSRIPALDAELSDLEVTTQPPDIARKGITKTQLNIFLYQAVMNGSWRNMDIPFQTRPGETGAPPLALDLYYLLTAFGRREKDTEVLDHRVLGGAMSVLHDHPLLGADEIRNALTGNDLANQFERVRITHQPMSLEEMSKLWTTFQTQYRISTAYEVAVILVDSTTPARTVLPVLKRGEKDSGVGVVSTSAPVLTDIRPPLSQPAARLGDCIDIIGRQLQTSDAVVRFTDLRSPFTVEVSSDAGGDDSRISVLLKDVPQIGDTPDIPRDPSALSRWAPGFYTVSLIIQHPQLPAFSSNELVCALAPTITVSPTAASPGDLTLSLTCAPRLRDGQRVALLFADRQIAPTNISTPADTAEPSTLKFRILNVAAGTYVVRLRVDGVDSLPVVFGGTPPVPGFDPGQQVIVS